jgi:hypothetical protein
MEQQPKKPLKPLKYIRIEPGSDVYNLLEQLGMVGKVVYVPKYWTNQYRKIPKRAIIPIQGKKYRSDLVLSPWARYPNEWAFLVKKGFAGRFLYALPKQTKRGIPWYLYEGA